MDQSFHISGVRQRKCGHASDFVLLFSVSKMLLCAFDQYVHLDYCVFKMCHVLQDVFCHVNSILFKVKRQWYQLLLE